MDVIEWLGYVGSAFLVASYVPQVTILVQGRYDTRAVSCYMFVTQPRMSWQDAKQRCHDWNVIGGATKASAEPALARRNMLLHTLVAVFGEEGAADFCRVFLDPRRWTKLKAAPFLE